MVGSALAAHVRSSEGCRRSSDIGSVLSLGATLLDLLNQLEGENGHLFFLLIVSVQILVQPLAKSCKPRNRLPHDATCFDVVNCLDVSIIPSSSAGSCNRMNP